MIDTCGDKCFECTRDYQIGNLAKTIFVTIFGKAKQIATAHLYSLRKFTCNAMHRARARSTIMNNDRADEH